LHLFSIVLDSIITPMHKIHESDLSKINRLRFIYSSLALGPSRQVKHQEIIEIQSKKGHKIPVHIYIPHNCLVNGPVIIHFHGGGFVLGDPKMYEYTTTQIADRTGCIVLSVDYRRSPEYKFPCAQEDCIEATQWIYDNIDHMYCADRNKLVLIGDSAGGNLTAIVTAELRHIVKLSIPIYPIITYGVASHSYLENSRAPILNSEYMNWFTLRHFSSYTQTLHPLACPLSQSSLIGVPRTHIITAVYDPLRDEGVLYVKALQEAGVDVTHKQYTDAHGFFANQICSFGEIALQDVCDLIADVFAKK
jgi:acetyl esterase